VSPDQPCAARDTPQPRAGDDVRYHALIAAAGSGARFGSDRPKQYASLDGKPLLVHVLERIEAGFPLQMTYVALAIDDRWYDGAVGARERVKTLRCGGKTRAETVRNALDAIPDAAIDDWILVHDAARPCVDAASLARLRQELDGDDIGGILAVPVVAALKRADERGRSARTEPRENLWQAQTPQMFRYGVLREALAKPGAVDAVDEAQAVEALGLRPRLVTGSTNNLKVSFSDDLLLAEAILALERGART
jgi:2-C-methyl-D-erythritol 4-phosphate cytidylyltransferase